jgi:MOSC domain-containing protein YiiM
MPDTLYKPNKNPKKSVKNTGFKNKEKALDTIRIVKELDKNHQMQIILTMYYRAEYHPNKTKDMIEAQKVFKKWLEKRNVKI